MKGIGLKLKHWLDWRHMSPQKAVSIVFVASVLLLVISYGVWQFGQLISPELILNQDNPTIILNVSDREGDGAPLPNTLDGGTPFYNYDINGDPTLLTIDNGALDHARLDIRLNYR